MSDKIFPVEISENEYFCDLSRAKVIVDHGIKDYFILLDPACFRNVKEIGNTTLKDIEDIFGLNYIQFFRFANYFKCNDNAEERDEYQSFRIRRPTKSDKAYLRGKLKYFPADMWCVDWRDGNGACMLLPFIQDEKTAEIKWLAFDEVYSKAYKKKEDGGGRPVPCFFVKSLIERLPDYFDCQLAICRYKGVDIAIPIAPKTAKVTFKNRDRDEFGVKRHIVHEVKAYKRTDSENEVEEHLRGTSQISIKGESIIISTSLKWSEERRLRKVLEKQAKKNKTRQ